MTRLGVANVLTPGEGFDVVGQAETTEEAERLVRSLRPDLVVLDIRLKGQTRGLDLLPVLKAVLPEAKVVLFTNYENGAYLHAALESGVSGYLLKDTPQDDLLRALKLIVSGSVVFSGPIGQSLFDLALGHRSLQPGGSHGLTPREHEVLKLLADGKNNDEIAVALNFSVKTIQGYLTSLYEKLRTHNRTEAVVAAARLGLLNIKTASPEYLPCLTGIHSQIIARRGARAAWSYSLRFCRLKHRCNTRTLPFHRYAARVAVRGAARSLRSG